MADSKKIVSYDFSIDTLISVDAPYGSDPDMLLDQVLIKLIQRARHQELILVCENIFDPETGYYEEIPTEWYKNP